jgi:deoxyribonuclease (pyrimidine dimer)
MVRVNLINPRLLADQHLIAEYDEILMLLGYVRKYPDLAKDKTPKDYTLGKGHIIFFKDKLYYVRRRHESLKAEMRRRGFVARKSVVIGRFPKRLCNEWQPSSKDFLIIKRRLVEKIRAKPGFYRYYGKKRSVLFLTSLVRKA